MEVNSICEKVKENAFFIASSTTEQKNDMLYRIALGLRKDKKSILKANSQDIKEAHGKPSHFIDRLTLNDKRIEEMANGLQQLIELPDPVGEVVAKWTVANGLEIEKARVPLGVVAIIYEARPNVTSDAIGLALKTGNAIVLRGSKDAINSNIAIVSSIKETLNKAGYNSNFIGLIQDTTRESATQLMKSVGLVDVLIPRGSAALIKTTIENSIVPVIETGAGNCHAYIHESASLDMATEILLNGKLSRPSVCNALESLLIDRAIAKTALPVLVNALIENGVEVVGCSEAKRIMPHIALATEEDFYEEFLSLKISVKVIDSVSCAVSHINKYGTKHSEVIVSSNKEAIEKFLNGVDSACVYANASTRFTDGFEFGFGAEVGISTQKLHARGPMGLPELTSLKYKILGNGQTR